MAIVRFMYPDQEPRRPARVLPWPVQGPAMFFRECQDYASRIDVLWARTDLPDFYRKRLIDAACIISVADKSASARAKGDMGDPPIIGRINLDATMAQALGLTYIDVDDLINIFELIEAFEEEFKEAI